MYSKLKDDVCIKIRDGWLIFCVNYIMNLKIT